MVSHRVDQGTKWCELKVLPERYGFACVFTNEELKVVSVLEPFFAVETLWVIPQIQVLIEKVNWQDQMALTWVLKHFIFEKSVVCSLFF